MCEPTHDHRNIEAAGVAGTIHHERFHRWFSRAVWEADKLGKVMFVRLVTELIVLAGDDTLAKKTGRKIYGAGYWRDGILSTPKHVVTR